MRAHSIAIPFAFFLLLAGLVVATAAGAETPAAGPLELKPGRERAVVAVVALNAGTEVTDFLVPYSVLNQAGAAVMAVAPSSDPVAFWPAASVRPDADFAQFDTAYPQGADIVVVPAVHDPDDAALKAWLQAQAQKGALMVSICEGSFALAAAGLLDGKRATGHFYEHENRTETFPKVRWERNRRYVEDEGVISSSGVSASLPISLMLTERLAGRDRAAELAAAYGVADYGPKHNTDAFNIGMEEITTALKNIAFGWPRAHYLIEVWDGVDEVNMAFPLDFAARTWRGSSAAIAAKAEIRTRHGLTIIADETGEAPGGARLVRLPGAPASAAEAAVTLASPATLREDFLAFIGEELGDKTAQFVATQLEYPRR
ncbi:DJ-1/PfpI family protein [Parvibaculum sp.]|uniref:DJ-1/PfpI family protein n=1 Tax=Parvibaculum sp. TaxID=2024848 RepID=UPI00349FF918